MALGKQILVIAEDPLVRHTKQLVLQELGFGVVSVGTVREAEFVASRTLFDLAILGRSVRSVNKSEAARVLRTKAPNLPILEICDQSPTVPRVHYVLHSPSPEELAAMMKDIFPEAGRSER
jgi:DNA-binding response OmpR family regulator